MGPLTALADHSGRPRPSTWPAPHQRRPPTPPAQWPSWSPTSLDPRRLHPGTPGPSRKGRGWSLTSLGACRIHLSTWLAARRDRPPGRRPRRVRPLLALRRRPRLRQGVAGVAGLAVALVVHGALAGAEGERARWGDQVEVLVATADLPAGHVLAPGDVEARPAPAGLVPTGAVTGSPAGRVVRHRLTAGEILADHRLAPDGIGGVAALLPEGTRAVAVPGDPATTPPLSPGDRVDVLVAPGIGTIDAGPPATAVRGAVVVDVGEAAITVAVPEAEAAAVAFGAGMGIVALALTGA